MIQPARDATRLPASGEGLPAVRPALTIAIPALNEEGAIGSIIERCQAARDQICAETDVARVDVVVVSDGSTDRTVEIARGYSGIHLVVFEKNRGYGAAIQAGWQARPNDLLSFLDADGTCDPLHFIPMCNAITRGGSDIALGSRMGPQSHMPRIRRVGNVLYATLLTILSGQKVRDTASGMRVIRRDALPRLIPLPDGLHFTPAMSARALLDDLKIVEVDMSYEERVGRSKLNVLRDGVRFLKVILATALYVRPSRLLMPVAFALAAAAALMMARPSLEYFQQHRVEDWMIYRFMLAGLFISLFVLLVGATHILEQLIAVSRGSHAHKLVERRRWWARLNERVVALAALALAVLGAVLAWPAAASYLATAHVEVHWSRILTSMFCELIAGQLGLTLMLNQIVRGVVRQQAGWLAAVGDYRPPTPR